MIIHKINDNSYINENYDNSDNFKMRLNLDKGM